MFELSHQNVEPYMKILSTDQLFHISSITSKLLLFKTYMYLAILNIFVQNYMLELKNVNIVIVTC